MWFAADDSRRSCGAHVKCREVSSFCELCYSDRWGAKCRGQRVCVSVCLSARVSQKQSQTSTKHLHTLDVCHLLPVLWMTSCFLTMGHMARGVGNIDVGGRLDAANSSIFAAYSLGGATLFDFVAVHSGSNCALGAKSAVCDCSFSCLTWSSTRYA